MAERAKKSEATGNTIRLSIRKQIRGKTLNECPELTTLEVDPAISVDDFKKLYAQKFRKYYPDRQRFTIPKQPKDETLELGKKLSDYKLADGALLGFKDLGPQVGWATVFFVEYVGPFLIYPIFYFWPSCFYSNVDSNASVVHKYAQTVALFAYSAHFLKRILETLFVHRFSKNTMPIANIFKNSIYYWGFAAFLSYFINHPLFTEPDAERVLICGVGFILSELCNLYCHLYLRSLRPAGSRKRVLPGGLFFSQICCPNYTFEIAAWLFFAAMTNSLPALIFAVVGGAQMMAWAAGKYRAYRREFPDKVGVLNRRKILIPFIW